MVNFLIRVGMKRISNCYPFLFCLILFSLITCAGTTDLYRDPNMDFGTIQSIAVMPFANLSRESIAGERVRDVFMNTLLATGGIYVVPPGEVTRGIGRAEVQNPVAPSSEEAVKLGSVLKVQAVITGVVREYGEIRSGSAMTNTISLSLQMIETQTGRVVWTGSSTRGGVTIWHRLFGGGGRPMNRITQKAVNEVINKLFK